MTCSVLSNISRWLNDCEVPYRLVTHTQTRTSAEAAKARGESIEIGGKSILMKTDTLYRLFVLSACFKIDSSKIKRLLKVKKMRFATADELHDLTGLVPGSVPPFGHPILPFDLYVDYSVLENDWVAFNAGSLTTSMVMSTRDYQSIAGATFCNFKK